MVDKINDRLYKIIYLLKIIKMTNLILIWVIVSTVITSVINAMKPAYKKIAWKWTITISTVLAFALWILASFSIVKYMNLELNTWLTFLIGLALWTGSNVFYDIWELIKTWSDKIKSALPIKNKNK